MKHLVSILAVSMGALAAACSSQNAASPKGQESTGDDGGGSSTSPGADASDDAPQTAPQALLRVAHLSPDLPPIDVCVAPHGTTAFQGPLLAQLADSLSGGDGGAEDASVPGLSYAQVSAYLALSPGQYDVRVVAAGAADCSTSLAQVRVIDVEDGGVADGGSLLDAGVLSDAGSDAGLLDAAAADAETEPSDGGEPEASADASATGIGDATSLPALSSNTSSTLLIAGDLSLAGSDHGLTFAVLTDDAVLAGGAAVLRTINAVPSSGSLDFGFTSPGGAWSSVFEGVEFAAAGSQVASGYGALDSNGYLSIAPVAAQAMSARRTGSDAGADLASASTIEIDMGSIATVIAVGGKTADVAHPPALLLCTDNQPSGGLLSDCSIAQ